MNYCLQLALLLFFLHGSTCVRLVNLIVPRQVARGEDVTLKCVYQLPEGRSLYCVKWFKGRSEIFRYTPSEEHQFKTFPRHDLEINVEESDASRLTLRNVKPNNSGVYRCEVSAEAPSFDTDFQEANMTVIDVPSEGPRINGVKPSYPPADKVILNCTSGPSKPAAVLNWYINGRLAAENFVRRLTTATKVANRGSEQKKEGEKQRDSLAEMESPTITLEIPAPSVEDRDFANTWNVSCMATVGDVYQKTAHALIHFNDARLSSLSKSTTSKPPYHLQSTGSATSTVLPTTYSLLILFTSTIPHAIL